MLITEKDWKKIQTEMWATQCEFMIKIIYLKVLQQKSVSKKKKKTSFVDISAKIWL